MHDVIQIDHQIDQVNHALDVERHREPLDHARLADLHAIAASLWRERRQALFDNQQIERRIREHYRR